MNQISFDMLSILKDISVKRNLQVDSNDLFNACINISTVNNPDWWKEILPEFCDKITEECEREDIEPILIALCDGIDRKNSLASICEYIGCSTSVVKYDQHNFDYNTMFKFNCLLRLLPFDMMIEVVNEYCDHSETIIGIIAVYYYDMSE